MSESLIEPVSQSLFGPGLELFGVKKQSQDNVQQVAGQRCSSAIEFVAKNCSDSSGHYSCLVKASKVNDTNSIVECILQVHKTKGSQVCSLFFGFWVFGHKNGKILLYVIHVLARRQDVR